MKKFKNHPTAPFCKEPARANRTAHRLTYWGSFVLGGIVGTLSTLAVM